jgi:uncharacterized membrane protein (UPF0127 family)
MKKIILLVFFFVVCSTFSCEDKLETVHIFLGGEKFTIELARTPQQRANGLMDRQSLKPNRGMLFVYDYDIKMSFYMKNTYIPLSIAFISKDGTIKEIFDMKPLSMRSVESTYLVRYALEVKQGTFDRLGLKPGDKIELPEL